MKASLTALIVLSVLASWMPGAAGFSLLGPFRDQARGASDPWQGRPYGGRAGGLGYNLPGDIGGPMLLQEGYRWNIPVITYGFDPSFTEYFGARGVEEVEKAIAILNALPAASEMSSTLEEFPLDTVSFNPIGDQYRLLDLKSHMLCLLLQQLGLASPERFVWSLRSRQASPSATNYTVVNLNYDPVTLAASSWVNGVLYNYVIGDSRGPAGEEDWASAVESYTFDPLVLPWSSLAGALGSRENARGPDSTLVVLGQIRPGGYFTGLTRDDVGGLRFLLSRLNRQWETLLPGVTGVGPSAQSFINAAQRPGVEKLTFQRQSYLAGEQRFQPVTNLFADVYFTNNVATTQMLQRIVTTPDILFRTADLGGRVSRFREFVNFGALVADSSDTSAWISHAELNGRPGGGGPGTIRPPIHITLNRLEPLFAATGGSIIGLWGAYDTFEAPAVLLATNKSDFYSLVVESRLVRTNDTVELEWVTLKADQLRYRVESSTNLLDWTPFTTIEAFSSSDNTFVLRHPIGQHPAFFRSIPEVPAP